MDNGVDITRISRFKDRSEKFINTILTPIELEYYNTLSDYKKQVFLATRWASKEAIFKATQDKNYLKYSILNDKLGKPYVVDYPNMKLSISHEDDIVIAFIIKE